MTVGQIKYKYKSENSTFPDMDITTNILLTLGLTKITKLGVQAPWRTKMIIDNKTIVVGATGIYELPEGIEISSLSFVNSAELKDVLIDYVGE